MKTPFPPAFEPDRSPDEHMEETAGMWLARCDRGLTEEETRAFEAWLRADPRHREVWEELARAFTIMDRAAALRPTGAPDPGLLARPVAKTGAPSKAARPNRTWGRLYALGGLAALLAMGLLLFREPAPPPPETETKGSFVRHAPDLQRLPDGSAMVMRPGAEVEVAFTEAQRRVYLQSGEAHFTVQPNPQRPFVVVAGGMEIRAVGTAFSVTHAGEEIGVIVTHGQVQVETIPVEPASGLGDPLPADAPVGPEVPLLVAGQRVAIPLAMGAPLPAVLMASLNPEEMERALSWRSTWLEFNEIPLEEVVQELNRNMTEAGQPRLTVADRQTGRMLVSGTVRADSADTFVRLLEPSFGVTSRVLSDGRVELRRQP